MNSSEYQNAHEKNLLQSYFTHKGNSRHSKLFFIRGGCVRMSCSYLWLVDRRGFRVFFKQKTFVEGNGISYLYKNPHDYLLSPIPWYVGLFRKTRSLLPEHPPHLQN